MRLVVYPQDTTAVYVAETETTQQLWGAVCPDNRHGWKIDSKYPATGVTREEVDAFISRLNTMAAEQECRSGSACLKQRNGQAHTYSVAK